MEEKYVSDEAYKKGQKVIKKIRTALLIIGLILLVGGITFIVLGATSTDSDGFGPNFAFLAPGLFMTVFSFPMLLYSLFATIAAHQREILAYQASATLPVAGEVGGKVIDFADKNSGKVGNALGNVFGGVVREVKKGWTGDKAEKTIVCPKCQYKNDPTDKFCGGCGEKLEQKRHCTNCGAELKAADNFCSACGTKVE